VVPDNTQTVKIVLSFPRGGYLTDRERSKKNAR